MDESLYLKFYLKLTAILDSGFEKKNLTICLTRYRNYNKEKVCVIKRSFYPPKMTGDHRIFVKNLFKFLHSRVEDIFYCFSVILLRKVKSRDEHIELKLYIISKYLPTQNIVKMFHNVETLQKRKTRSFKKLVFIINNMFNPADFEFAVIFRIIMSS